MGTWIQSRAVADENTRLVFIIKYKSFLYTVGGLLSHLHYFGLDPSTLDTYPHHFRSDINENRSKRTPPLCAQNLSLDKIKGISGKLFGFFSNKSIS